LILPIILLSCKKEKEMSFQFDGTYWNNPSYRDIELVIYHDQCTQNHYDNNGEIWLKEPFGSVQGQDIVQGPVSYRIITTLTGVVLTQNGNPTNQLIYYRK
jgi:hypothetical protein